MTPDAEWQLLKEELRPFEEHLSYSQIRRSADQLAESKRNELTDLCRRITEVSQNFRLRDIGSKELAMLFASHRYFVSELQIELRESKVGENKFRTENEHLKRVSRRESDAAAVTKFSKKIITYYTTGPYMVELFRRVPFPSLLVRE
ncbi:MAG: hypothetical protein ACRDL7_00620, partial [Gaiellaceae bacterium]